MVRFWHAPRLALSAVQLRPRATTIGGILALARRTLTFTSAMMGG
jgi:hypothetical protein